MVAHLKIFALIAGISAALYANSLQNSFHFDDQHYIAGNPYIREISNIPSFFKSSQYSSFEKAFSGHYRPLLVTSYALNYAVGGLNPAGYHIVNLLFHIGSAFLVYLIVQAMLGSATFIPIVAALIFAVHPFNSEVVNYITARSSVMCSFFYLLSFYCWILFRSQKKSYLLPLASYFYFASLLAFILAMLTKEIAVTLPVMLFLFDLYFFQFRILHAASRTFKYYIPYILLVILPYLIYRISIFSRLRGGESGDFYANLLTQPKVLLKYLQLMFLPLGLTIDHDIPLSSTIYDIPTISCILILLMILAAVYWLFKKGGEWRILSFFIVWFFITLLPTTIIPLNAILQENRGYLAEIVFPLLAGICIGRLPRRRTIPLLLILISLYSILTVQRNSVWKDDFTLWTDAVGKAPTSARAHDNLGLAYIGKGKYDLALAEFNKTLELSPRYFLAYYNAGVVYQLQNRLDMARSSYEAGIRINPRYFRSYYNLGIVYKKTGDLDKAIDVYEKAISLDQRHPFVYNNLGVVLTEKGETDRAVAVFKKAIEINPRYEKAYFNLGNIYYKRGKYDLAVEAYRSALRVRPDYGEAKKMLATALTKM